MLPSLYPENYQYMNYNASKYTNTKTFCRFIRENTDTSSTDINQACGAKAQLSECLYFPSTNSQKPLIFVSLNI